MVHRRNLLAVPLAMPLVAASGAGIITAGTAWAQAAWPERPVRVIVPWPPAGSTDVLVRIYADRLQAMLGQNFVVENRAGAGGNIGIDAVAKAPPDGYTIGIASVGHFCINPTLYARLAYDPAKDLVPVGVAWELPNALVVPTGHNPSRTMAEFVAWAKARRSGVTYGSPGVGTTPHLSGALLANRTGFEGIHVPFRGAAQAIPVMLGGQLDFALDNLASYVPIIQEGRMRALAVTSAGRFPTMPEVPTMAEAGIADFVVTSWQSFVFPAGTPRAGVERLSAALRQLSEDPALQRRFLEVGAAMAWSSPADTLARVAKETPMWQDAVRISGARVE